MDAQQEKRESGEFLTFAEHKSRSLSLRLRLFLVLSRRGEPKGVGKYN